MRIVIIPECHAHPLNPWSCINLKQGCGDYLPIHHAMIRAQVVVRCRVGRIRIASHFTPPFSMGYSALHRKRLISAILANRALAFLGGVSATIIASHTYYNASPHFFFVFLYISCRALPTRPPRFRLCRHDAISMSEYADTMFHVEHRPHPPLPPKLVAPAFSQCEKWVFQIEHGRISAGQKALEF